MINNNFECPSIFPIFFQNYENEYENDHSLTNGTSDSLSDSFNFLFQRDPLDSSFKNEFLNLSPACLSPSEKNEKNCIKENIFKESKDNTIENINESLQNEEKDSSENILIQLSRKKRGRNKIKNSKEMVKIHDKFSTDNLLRKVQVHYISFIVTFLNKILEVFNFKERFYKLDYEFKKNVNKKFVSSLKKKTIGEIICNKISVKYRKQKEDANKIIYEQIKENKVLSNILSENYLSFFKKVYYKSNKIFNLKEYGIDINIVLSKNVKMYKDLLKDNEVLDTNKEYQKNMNECVIQNFLPNSIFLLH